MSDYVAIKLGNLRDGVGITVDSKLSLTSSNPVQNKVVTKAIEDLKESIEEFPDADANTKVKYKTFKIFIGHRVKSMSYFFMKINYSIQFELS